MYKPEITNSISLSIHCQPIHILMLTTDGILPDKISASESVSRDRELHVCRHLPPSNITEETLLSIWINTHQAMFFNTGISAYCVQQLIELINQGASLKAIRDMNQLAVDCRLASAAYTSLPYLTKELYQAYIRESMMLVHLGFSGVSNQESIAMEVSLRLLKTAVSELGYRNRRLATSLTDDLKRLYDADKTWWIHHGKAMARMVDAPVSLARMDFKNQLKDGSGDKDFNDYRQRILRKDNALNDYDEYFAVKRSAELTIEDYRNNLSTVLERSQPYVDPDGELADYRKKGGVALYNAVDYAFEKNPA